MKASIIYILTKKLKHMNSSFKTFIAFAAIIFATQNATASVKQLIGDRQNNWSSGTSTFVGYDSTTYEYDGNGKLTLEHHFTYNSGTGWKETSQDVYTYSGNLLTNKTTYGMSTGTQVNSFKIDYTYNGNNQLTVEARWLWVSSAWFGINRFTSDYDVQQRLITYTTENWVSNNWRNQRRTQYGSFNGTVPTMVVTQTWSTGSSIWVNNQQFTHVLYSNTLKDSAVAQANWVTGSSTWDAIGFTIYTYNGNGDYVTQEFYEWFTLPFVGTLPFPQWKYSYTYSGNVLTQLYHEVSYNGSSTLTVKDVTNYTLDINNHWYVAVRQNYDTTAQAFINDAKTFFDYDIDGDLRHSVNQNWDGSAWINFQEFYYWYSSTPSGIEEITETKPLKVFPNPFTQTAIVEFNLNETSKAKIQVFDLNGRLVQQTETMLNEGTNQWVFDGTELNAGLYFIKIETVKEKFIQKVSKF